MNEFINNLSNKPLILSIDLDNTLVNRAKGGNYVDEKIKINLLKLVNNSQVIIIPNSGRDALCVRSFFRDVYNFKNAIIGSGSAIIHHNKIDFNRASELNKNIVNKIIIAVKNNFFPFVDIYHATGRVIFFNPESLTKYKGLFFQQNPQEWFGGALPPVFSVKEADKNLPVNIFRLEFPVKISQNELYQSLLNKELNSIQYLTKMLAFQFDEENYNLKRKKYFCDLFKNELTFARLGKSENLVNKGLGLKFWLDQENIDPKEFNIIHIGDQDSGLINDTLVKKIVPSAHLVMVGSKCSQTNSLVDLYLPDNNVDKSLGSLFELLVDKLC